MTTVMRETAPGRFRVEGELSFATITPLWRDSARLLSKAAGRVSIDLGGVTRADSAALALLVEWLRLAAHGKFELHLIHPPQRLLAQARAYDLELLLPVADGLENG